MADDDGVQFLLEGELLPEQLKGIKHSTLLVEAPDMKRGKIILRTDGPKDSHPIA